MQTLTAEIFGNKKQTLVKSRQRQVDSTLELLVSDFERDGLLLDLYGENDQPYGYIVCDVALAGTTDSLRDLLSDTMLGSMSQWCDDYLPNAEQLAENDRNDAYIARRG